MTAHLEIRDLTKRFAERTALSGVSLEMDGGSVTTLLGPNGSGKTTLIKSILGLLKPDAGTIAVDGIPGQIPYPTVLRRKFLYIPDDPIIVEYLTGLENLEYMCALYGAELDRRQLKSILEKYGLAEAENKLAKDYSRGMRQKLCLSYMELYSPEILILDEPTNGLDVLAIRQTETMLRSLAAEGKIVLVATHDMSFCKGVSDRVAVIRQGELVAHRETGWFTARYGSLENAAVELLRDGLNGEDTQCA